MDVVTETFTLLLSAVPKLTGVARPGVGALEVADEGVLKLLPVVDPSSREVLEPRSCQVCEVQRDVLDDEEVVGRPSIATGEAVVLEPYARVGLAVVLGHRGRGTVACRRCHGVHVQTEGPRTTGVRCRAPASIFVAVVATAAPLVVSFVGSAPTV